MIIKFYDGSYAECSKFEIVGDKIYWDDYRYAPMEDVEEIVDM